MTPRKVGMKTRLASSIPRCPKACENGVPNSQLNDSGPKTANTHGQYGTRRHGGETSGGNTMAARTHSGNAVSEAARKHPAHAYVCTRGPPMKKVQCVAYVIAPRKKLRPMGAGAARKSTSTPVMTIIAAK